MVYTHTNTQVSWIGINIGTRNNSYLNNFLYRHLDKESLCSTLQSDKLCSRDIEQVMQLVDKGRYTEACRAHHTARVGLVVQSHDGNDNKVIVSFSCKAHVIGYLIQTPIPESNDNGHAVFINPAQYFTSFVDEIQSDSE